MDSLRDLTRTFEMRKALVDIADFIMCKMHKVPMQEQPERLKRFIAKATVTPYQATDQAVVNEVLQPLADIIAGAREDARLYGERATERDRSQYSLRPGCELAR